MSKIDLPKSPSGTVFVWNVGNDEPSTHFQTLDPEGNVDGDAFWMWVSDDTILINFEIIDGQARDAAAWLLKQYPELVDMELDDTIMDPGCNTLGEMVDMPLPPLKTLAEVTTWFHGTTSTRLPAILQEGLSGSLVSEMRCWSNVPDPRARRGLPDHFAPHGRELRGESTEDLWRREHRPAD